MGRRAAILVVIPLLTSRTEALLIPIVPLLSSGTEAFLLLVVPLLSSLTMRDWLCALLIPIVPLLSSGTNALPLLTVPLLSSFAMRGILFLFRWRHIWRGILARRLWRRPLWFRLMLGRFVLSRVRPPVLDAGFCDGDSEPTNRQSSEGQNLSPMHLDTLPT
jgi:hypothetical protein